MGNQVINKETNEEKVQSLTVVSAMVTVNSHVIGDTCCDRSRPDRFMVFGQMEEYSQIYGVV